MQKILFQILDEGALRTAQGKKISFRHAIVILTANADRELYASPSMGFGGREKHTAVTDAVMAKAKEQFGSALMGRVGHTLVFQPLTLSDMSRIVTHRFEELSERLKEKHHIAMTPDADVLQTLSEQALAPQVGARPISTMVSNIFHYLPIKIIL